LRVKFLLMIDLYKSVLELLLKIMKEEKYDNWTEWLQKDIVLWESSNSTEHHLRAYGGMGSFNDVYVGGNDTNGIWKSKVFEVLQSMAYSLAKSGEMPDIFVNLPNIINGWRCQNCASARINDQNIEIYLAGYFVPKLIKQLIDKQQLHGILNIDKITDLEEVKSKRESIKETMNHSNITTMPKDYNWLETCPNCGSRQVIYNRWVVNQNNDLTPADDN
jgi:hypothetical protein